MFEEKVVPNQMLKTKAEAKEFLLGATRGTIGDYQNACLRICRDDTDAFGLLSNGDIGWAKRIIALEDKLARGNREDS
jgi:hypothetical protein